MLDLLRSVQMELSSLRTQRSEIIEMNRKITICVKDVLKMMRKFALTVLNVVGRVILLESDRQVRETGGA